MKRDKLMLIKSLIALFVCVMAVSCEKTSLEIPYFEMRPVSKYQKDSMELLMTYNKYANNSNVAEFNRYINNTLVSKAFVVYKGDNIQCSIDGVHYTIQWENIRGGVRVSELTATINGAQYFTTSYRYYPDGRIRYASVSTFGGPYETFFEYEDTYIEVMDKGFVKYRIMLGGEENTGNVCNVLGFLEAPITNQFVIIPELYFLNIFGAPIDRLPGNFPITRSANSLRVGSHYYEFQ